MIITNKHWLIAFISALLLIACSDDPSSSGKRNKREHLVDTHQAEIQAVRTQLRASGSLKAERNLRIHNEISARIIELPFYPGDAVNEDDVLVRLDDSIIEAEYEKALAQKKQAKIDYQRLKKLKPKQLASEEEVARAKTAYEVAIAEEKLQYTRLQQSLIKAPFAGLVTERYFEPGDAVSSHSHILSLIDPDSLKLVIYLAEQWIPFINLGDHVSLRIDALGEAVFDGRISRIYPGIDKTTRKGTVEISFDVLPFGARAGQLVHAKFYTRSVDRLVVPAHSIHHDAKGAYVYTVEMNSKVKKQHIKKSHQYGDLIAVDAGLDINSQVVTRGFIGLRNGKTVKPVNIKASGVTD